MLQALQAAVAVAQFRAITRSQVVESSAGVQCQVDHRSSCEASMIGGPGACSFILAVFGCGAVTG